MLHVLGLAFLLGSGTLHAEAAFENPSTQEIKEQSSTIKDVLKQANDVAKTKEFLNEIETNKHNIHRAVIDSGNNYYKIPESYHTDDLQNMANILSQKGDITGKQQPHGITAPIILISFSMPRPKIEELLLESEKTGALIAIRGLVEDDMKKTVNLIAEYSKGRETAGIILDPTLFDRFKVDAVPAFILPMEPVKGCDPDGCSVPQHVSARGNSSLFYFLDLISRTGTDAEKEKAKVWLAKYGETK